MKLNFSEFIQPCKTVDFHFHIKLALRGIYLQIFIFAPFYQGTVQALGVLKLSKSKKAVGT